jgi:hypothetical protein
MIIDVFFTVVLALTAGGETQQVSAVFPTLAACKSFRGERIDYVNELPAKDKEGKVFYISECTANPMQKVTK